MTFNNVNSEKMSLLAIVALYTDSGKMALVKSLPVSIPATLKQQKQQIGLELPADRVGYTVKVMFWNPVTYVPLSSYVRYPD